MTESQNLGVWGKRPKTKIRKGKKTLQGSSGEGQKGDQKETDQGLKGSGGASQTPPWLLLLQK